jgi:two-component system, chemotaxis family, response regulator PixG
MASDITVMSQLMLKLMTLQQQRATGELTLTLDHQQTSPWRIFLYMGRLAYATGGHHPVRRWYRAMRAHCPEFFEPGWQTQYRAIGDVWEADVLHQAVAAGKVSATQARSVVQTIVQEVFFTFIERQTIDNTWNAGVQLVEQATFLSVEQVIQDSLQLREQWRNQGLGSLQELLRDFSPDLAPIIRNPELLQSKVNEGTYKTLTRLMRGKLTLWDIALQLKKPLPGVMRSLLPLIRQGAITLKTVSDEIPPLAPAPAPETAAKAIPQVPKKLIACIDDSPLIISLLKDILEPQGYDVLAINDPLHGIAMLLSHKPDLILLDLVMPSTNGYELCNFLRKTTVFQRTPIVILTSRDKVVDRMRAKQVGSSDFLSKPPEPDKLLSTIARLINEQSMPKPQLI